jgi:EAL domain-containing protein (putative c-di-GMP-specific phosphodiesterase class I)
MPLSIAQAVARAVDHMGVPIGKSFMLRDRIRALIDTPAPSEPTVRSTAPSPSPVAAELARALERGELRLVWQPLVRLGSGRAHAAEALVRWQHPDRGLLTPDQFIPLAEETGLIVPLGRWVIGEACRQAAAWISSGDPILREFRVAVNISTRQLADETLVDTVRKAMARTGLGRGRLVLEITESTLMEDPDRAAETLRELAALGLGVAIDDFGTGYSSLAALKHLDLDALKLDRSLVTGVARGTRDSAIVEAVVAMSRALDLRMVAEGVESEEELRELRRLGCDLAQGFYFARPVPAKELEALLAEGIAWPEGMPDMPDRMTPPPTVEA